MINRLSNPINRNRSAAKISKVMSSSKRCNQCKPCKQRQQFKEFKAFLILVFLLIIIESEHEYITSPSSGCEQHKLTLISTFCASFCLKCTSSCGNRHGTRARQQYTLQRAALVQPEVLTPMVTHDFWPKPPFHHHHRHPPVFLIEGVHTLADYVTSLNLLAFGFCIWCRPRSFPACSSPVYQVVPG